MKISKEYIIEQINKFVSTYNKLPSKIDLDKLPAVKSRTVNKILGKRDTWQDQGIIFIDGPKCAICYTPLSKKKKQTKFCSHQCLTESKTKYKNCIHCNGTLKSGKIYCSSECSTEHKISISKTIFDNNQPNNFGPRILKRCLIQNFGHKCSNCKNTEWMNKPIPLEIEHIDGNSQNNKKENLCLLCPNCHAQTSTYKAKNKGNGRAFRRQRYAEGKSY